MEYEREVLPPYTWEELTLFEEEGARVYMELMEKYDAGTVDGAHMAFNIMCGALIWWLRKIINPDDRREVIHFMYRTIMEGVEDA